MPNINKSFRYVIKDNQWNDLIWESFEFEFRKQSRPTRGSVAFKCTELYFTESDIFGSLTILPNNMCTSLYFDSLSKEQRLHVCNVLFSSI
jgi:hypothetical protein